MPSISYDCDHVQRIKTFYYPCAVGGRSFAEDNTNNIPQIGAFRLDADAAPQYTAVSFGACLVIQLDCDLLYGIRAGSSGEVRYSAVGDFNRSGPTTCGSFSLAQDWHPQRTNYIYGACLNLV